MLLLHHTVFVTKKGHKDKGRNDGDNDDGKRQNDSNRGTPTIHH